MDRYPLSVLNCFSWSPSKLESVLASPLIHVLPSGSCLASLGKWTYATSSSWITSSFQSFGLPRSPVTVPPRLEAKPFISSAYDERLIEDPRIFLVGVVQRAAASKACRSSISGTDTLASSEKLADSAHEKFGAAV